MIREYFMQNTTTYNELQFNTFMAFAKEKTENLDKILIRMWFRYFENKNCFIFQNSFFKLLFIEEIKNLGVKYIKRQKVIKFMEKNKKW